MKVCEIFDKVKYDSLPLKQIKGSVMRFQHRLFRRLKDKGHLSEPHARDLATITCAFYFRICNIHTNTLPNILLILYSNNSEWHALTSRYLADEQQAQYGLHEINLVGVKTAGQISQSLFSVLNNNVTYVDDIHTKLINLIKQIKNETA